MKKAISLFCLLSLLFGCGKHEENISKEEQLNKIISENNYLVVDVRTKEEYDEGHVIDAILLPYDEIDDPDLDISKTILVYCRSGRRSAIAANKLRELGYEVFDMGAYESVPFEKE